MKRVIRTFTVAFLICLYLRYMLYQVWSSHDNGNVVQVPYVIVHLDLKGAPPKLSYLESLLPLLKRHGANALLIEYEDIFPYQGALVNLSAVNCYKKDEVLINFLLTVSKHSEPTRMYEKTYRCEASEICQKTNKCHCLPLYWETGLHHFLTEAVNSGFEVIPLIQTFGHLEYALKRTEFQHLREIANYPDSICPSRDDSKAFLKHMIQQIIDFHREIFPIKFIHIGCDEVYHMNHCKACQERHLRNEIIFMQHVVTMSAYIKSSCPNTTVLIWDDMLRHMKPSELIKINLRDHVEPVYWDYTSDNHSVPHTVLYKYYSNFNHIWIASAFKGADGPTTVFPNITARFMNNYNWMKFIKGYKFANQPMPYTFSGIFLTGWSRYSHFAPLCELLPASLLSLVLDLMVIEEFKYGKNLTNTKIEYTEFYESRLEKRLRKLVKIRSKINLKDLNDVAYYIYDNDNVCIALKAYVEFTKMNIYSDYHNSHPRNINNFVNPNNIEDNYKRYTTSVVELRKLEEDMTDALSPYYDQSVVKEYVYSKTKQYKQIYGYMLTKL